jgi:hypothetical protein
MPRSAGATEKSLEAVPSNLGETSRSRTESNRRTLQRHCGPVVGVVVHRHARQAAAIGAEWVAIGRTDELHSTAITAPVLHPRSRGPHSGAERKLTAPKAAVCLVPCPGFSHDKARSPVAGLYRLSKPASLEIRIAGAEEPLATTGAVAVGDRWFAPSRRRLDCGAIVPDLIQVSEAQVTDS